MANLLPIVQFFGNLGEVLEEGLIYTYTAGTTTALTAYQDADDIVPHSNPIILDSAGRPPGGSVYLASASPYKLVIQDKNGATQQTLDNVNGLGTEVGDVNLASEITLEKLQFASGNGIFDTNSNEYLTFTPAASAVNYLNLTNAASGSGPALTAAGSDTNIDLTITPKGSGNIILDGLSWPTADGTANQILKTDGSGNLAFASAGTLLADAQFVPYGKFGFKIANTSGTSTTDIDISPGNAADATNAVGIALTSTITKQIDATWAVGDNQGGRPSGVSLTANTTYHVFVIRKSSDGTVDAGFDTSLTASNLLTTSSYNSYRRIGSIKTNGSSEIINFNQVKDTFYLTTPVEITADPNDNTEQTIDLTPVPTGKEFRVVVNPRYLGRNANSNTNVFIYKPEHTDWNTIVGGGFYRAANSGGDVDEWSVGGGPIDILCNTSAQVTLKVPTLSGSSNTLAVGIIAYTDSFEEGL